MSKYIPTKLTQLSANESAAVDVINKNLDSIKEHIDDSLSRSAKSPSQMQADLDMNGKKIINIGRPTNDTDLVRKIDVVESEAAIKQMADAVQAIGAQVVQVAAAAGSSAAEAVDSAALAEAWATKMDGPVDDDKYSSKYYAENIGADVHTVAEIAEDVTAVAGKTSEVTTVAGIASDVSTVAGIASDVSAVEDIASDVSTVASNISDVSAVANDVAKVAAVADDLTNIDSVADDLTNIDAVNSNKTNIDTVAGVAEDVTAVAGNNSNVTTVATNIGDVNDCADNIEAIADASTQAANAAASAALAQQYGNDKINQTHISNCLTEIPQDIKLELNNGTLTLKAGSKVYVPNGFEQDGTTPKFDVITIENDIVPELMPSGDGSAFIIYDAERDKVYAHISVSSCGSGTTSPTTGNGYFYNTTTNILTYHSGASYEERLYALPLGVIVKSSDEVAIRSIFNGFGYIGNTIFSLPGIKGLIPNGRNDDGTLKSTEFTTSGVFTETNPNYGTKYIQLNGSGVGAPDVANLVYSQEKNVWLYNGANNYHCMVGFYQTDGSSISNFTPGTVYDSIDLNNSIQKQGDTMLGTLTSRASTPFRLCQPAIVKGTNPSSDKYNVIEFLDSKGGDVAESRMGTLYHQLKSDGTSVMHLSAVRSQAGSTTTGDIWVQVNSSGNSGCSFPNTFRCDGQWVESSSQLADGVSMNASTNLTYTLSQIPNDGHKYMVLILASPTTGATSGNYVLAQVTSAVCAAGVNICRAQTRTNSSIGATGAAWVPVGSDRKITLNRSTSYNGTCNLYMRGYRRIGDNS